MATPAYPPNDPTPFKDVLSVFATALDKVDTHMTARLNRMEIAMGNMAKVATEALQVATSARQETKDGLERLHTGVVNAAKCSLASSEKIEMILGDVSGDPDADPEHERATVLGRIRQLERAVVELSESVSDPDAARPTIVRHEAGVNTDPVVRQLVDAGVDTLDLEPPVRRIDADVQVDMPAQIPTVSFRPPRSSVGAQLNRYRVAPQSEGSPALRAASVAFAVQPLAPAHWSPAAGYTDGSSSSATSKVPSPSVDTSTERLLTANAPATVPSASSEGRASSIFDEQEILQSLGADADGGSHPPSSPSPVPAPHKPPTPPLPRTTPVIPRRSAFVQSSAASGSPISVASASPPTKAIAASSPASQSQQNGSPPIPRRNVIAAMAAAAASTSASMAHMTTMAAAATLMSSSSSSAPAPAPAPRPPVPIPRGFGRMNAISVGTTSSPSSASQPSPTRAPAATPSTPGSLSSLSSLSSPPKSQAQTSSSRSDGSSASAPVAAPSRGTSTRGRGKGAARGGRAGASASARVTVKKERSEPGQLGPAAKRRKTMGNVDDVSASASTPGGKAARGRGGGGARGRGRGGTSNGKSAAQAKPKADPPGVGTDCRWPAKIDGDEAYQREFVQCDNCEAWYHFGCVGLQTGDPRLEPDAEFVCPPCESSSSNHQQRQGLRFQEAACMRPDCERAGLAEDTNEYFVERIIGRRPYEADIADGVKRPSRFLWLVKWDGWKAESASWQERAHLGDCARFIEEFEEAAEIEGRAVDKLDQVIVLNEGMAAGW